MSKRSMRQVDLLDMRVAGVNEALLARLDGLIRLCGKGGEIDKILDDVHTSWRKRR